MEDYEILGVPRNSSLQELKIAYHKLAHLNHPDKGGDTAKMKEINNAYQNLSKSVVLGTSTANYSQENRNREIFKCEICKKETYYTLCVECWKQALKERKRQRIKNVRTYMRCLCCGKSLEHRTLITLFCDTNCSKKYYKENNRKLKTDCTHDFCLSEEDGYRLNTIDLEEVVKLNYKERIAIFTRLIGKHKAKLLDVTIQNKLAKK